jgi:hypothetical protein
MEEIAIDNQAAAPAEERPARPTPEAIDETARLYINAKIAVKEAQAELESFEQECIDMVTLYGIVPPNAEKSRRLNGRFAELTVTKSDQLTLIDDRVDVLKEALEANGHSEIFDKLFTLHSKWEVVKGAAAALKTVQLPKRLAEKVMNLWGRCIDVKAKKPSLKVVMADPAKPAKKRRAKKGGAQ